MKQCSKCKEIKPHSAFHKSRTYRHSQYCKKCMTIYSKLYRLQIKKKYSGLHPTWTDIKQRCLNSKRRKFKYYGGRGITVCKEWQDSFLAFYTWAKGKHKEGLEIDRIDNDKGYYPENCRFTTHLENMRNSSVTILNKKKVKKIKRLLKEGKLEQKEIAKEFGVIPKTISDIYRHNNWKDIN